MIQSAALQSEATIMNSRSFQDLRQNIQPTLVFTAVKTGIFMGMASYFFGSKNYVGTMAYGLSSNLFGTIGNQATKYVESKVGGSLDSNTRKCVRVVFSNILPILASMKVCSQMGYKTNFSSLAALSMVSGVALLGACALTESLGGSTNVKFNF